MQIYDLLRQDHQKVRTGLKKIMESGDGAEKTRQSLFEELHHDLEVHTAFEEDVFYPTFRDDKNDEQARDEVKDALNEHDEAKTMLAKMADMDKTSPEFIEHCRTLLEALEHHISDEEDEIFPQAREAVSAEEAEDMGKRYQEFKRGH